MPAMSGWSSPRQARPPSCHRLRELVGFRNPYVGPRAVPNHECESEDGEMASMERPAQRVASVTSMRPPCGAPIARCGEQPWPWARIGSDLDLSLDTKCRAASEETSIDHCSRSIRPGRRRLPARASGCNAERGDPRSAGRAGRLSTFDEEHLADVLERQFLGAAAPWMVRVVIRRGLIGCRCGYRRLTPLQVSRASNRAAVLLHRDTTRRLLMEWFAVAFTVWQRPRVTILLVRSIWPEPPRPSDLVRLSCRPRLARRPRGAASGAARAAAAGPGSASVFRRPGSLAVQPHLH